MRAAPTGPGELTIEGLAQSLSAVTFERIPDAIRERATCCILDALGVGLAGASHPIVRRVEQAAAALGGTGRSTVLGGRPPRSLLDAALLNGTAMQVHDYNDVHLPSRTHPSVAILPALLAMAEARRSPGRDVVVAYLAGYEVETAIGESLLPEHYARGWHPTATLGGFGAAASVARLLGLTHEATCHALNLAGTQAGGVRAAFGGVVKHVHPGKAAMNGLLAASWAEAGLTSGADTLADRFGFAMAATGRAARPPARADGAWAIEQATLKGFPCCLEGHPAVELALRLRSAGLDAGALETLTIRLHPDVVSLVGHAHPPSGTAAKFSLQHCVALALVHGTVAIEHFDEDPGAPGPVAETRHRIRLVVDRNVAYSEAIGEAVDRAGRVVRERVMHARGSPAEPFTPDEARAKYLRLAAPVIGARRAAELMDLVLRLDSLPDVSPLMAATQPP